MLGLKPTPVPDATSLKSAFRRESLKHHPDKNLDDPDGATQRFQRVGEAFQVIAKQQKRASGTRRSHDDDEDDEDDETGMGDFFGMGKDGMPEDEILMSLFMEHLGLGNLNGLKRKQRELLEKIARDAKISAKLDQAEAEAEARRAKALEKKDSLDREFWERQRACGAKEKKDGGQGCYLHWDIRQLQREVGKRKLQLPRKPKTRDIAEALLQDDERKAPKSAKKAAAARAAAAAKPSSLVGERVEIFGVSRAELNGIRGVAQALTEATPQSAPRYRVQLDDGSLLAFRPENVRAVAPAPAPMATGHLHPEEAARRRAGAKRAQRRAQAVQEERDAATLFEEKTRKCAVMITGTLAFLWLASMSYGLGCLLLFALYSARDHVLAYAKDLLPDLPAQKPGRYKPEDWISRNFYRL